MSWWKRRDTGLVAPDSAKKEGVPEGLWGKCRQCPTVFREGEFAQNRYVCGECGWHGPLDVRGRIDLLVDDGSFAEFATGLTSRDPLSFVDQRSYSDRIVAANKKNGKACTEAIIVGEGKIEDISVMFGAMAFEYMGGSMGSVVGERLARLFEEATIKGVPAVVCSSSGGARMQEGIFSLMQMAKTTAALSKLKEAGQPYISVLLHPTTGGVAASFSMLGDVNIAEQGALIGFAGPRVIEQTIRQTLPEGFQRPDFLIEHGMIDMIVKRQEMKQRIGFLLRAMTCNAGQTV